MNTYRLKYYPLFGEGEPLANVLKEESIHWMICVMLFMWSCYIDSVILCLWRLPDRQSNITRMCISGRVSTVLAVLCRMYHCSCQWWNPGVHLTHFWVKKKQLTNWIANSVTQPQLWKQTKSWHKIQPVCWKHHGFLLSFDKSQCEKAKASLCVVNASKVGVVYSVNLTLFILQPQSDFKGNPYIQILISLQNNGKPLLYCQCRREITHTHMPNKHKHTHTYTHKQASFLSTFPI